MLGAYTASVGVTEFRKDIAKFIEKRDGYSADYRNILLTSGASDGIRVCMCGICLYVYVCMNVRVCLSLCLSECVLAHACVSIRVDRICGKGLIHSYNFSTLQRCNSTCG